MTDETLQPKDSANQPDEAPHNEIAKPEVPAADEASFALKHPLPPPEPRRPRERDKEKEEASQSPFSVTVGQVYDGPLDLLLDLIRKQNIDIYDIPIARITAQFLDYTQQLKQADVDSAGEFIYMASLLIHIKSKMLLPRDPSDVTGTDSEDPRRELVERLLEHERFKAAAQMLLQKQQIEEATWTNPGIREFKNDEGTEREIAADTVDLVRVFREVLDRVRQRPVLDVDEESVTVAQMIDYVRRRLVMEERPVSLRRLLHNTHTERALICMFLAMLELVRLQAVLLHQPETQGDILIKKTDNFDQVFADHQQARDDWR
jgi:segregation and condensation protein A